MKNTKKRVSETRHSWATKLRTQDTNEERENWTGLNQIHNNGGNTRQTGTRHEHTP